MGMKVVEASPLVGIIGEELAAEIARLAAGAGIDQGTLSALEGAFACAPEVREPTDEGAIIRVEDNLKQGLIRISQDQLQASHNGDHQKVDRAALAYSLFGWYHAELFREFRHALRQRYGRTLDSNELDTNYFVGNNDFNTAGRTDGHAADVFSAKASRHLSRARDIWEETKDAHRSIAYRHARAADIYRMLYQICPSDQILDVACAYAGRARDLRRSASRKDCQQIDAICGEIEALRLRAAAAE